jgi:hypothetical protein
MEVLKQSPDKGMSQPTWNRSYGTSEVTTIEKDNKTVPSNEIRRKDKEVTGSRDHPQRFESPTF